MSNNLITTVTFKGKVTEISRDKPTVMIGEKINPTGRKKVLQALQENDFESVRTDAISQVEAGARMLDVNAGVPGADEVVARVGRRFICVAQSPYPTAPWDQPLHMGGGTMPTRMESSEINIEEVFLRFLSPNGLMYAVGLILFTVVLFGGSGVENRAMDNPLANEYKATASPLLSSGK